MNDKLLSVVTNGNFQGQSKTDCPFRYQGQYEDAETGLYYNRFRYYSPEEGMYLSQDPIGLAGGQVNVYNYMSDINKLVDPAGLISENMVYVLKNGDDIVYVGIGNPDERFNAHNSNPDKKGQFDKMEVIVDCNNLSST